MNRARLVEWVRARLGMLIVPSVDRLALYRAKVTGQSSDLATADVEPDDRRLPALSRVPVEWSGAKIEFEAGAAWVLLGWKGGDARQPYCVPSVVDSATVINAVYVDAGAIYIGHGPGGSGSEPAAKGQTLKTYLDDLNAKLLLHKHTGGTIMGLTGTVDVSTPLPASVPDFRADAAQVK